MLYEVITLVILGAPYANGSAYWRLTAFVLYLEKQTEVVLVPIRKLYGLVV